MLLRSACFLPVLAALVLCAALSSAALAQPDPLKPEGANLTTPPSWRVLPDHARPDLRVGSVKDSVDIWFVNMTPGWHVTTGPAALFYHPASTAEGNYRVTSTLHLFDPQGRNEGYGLFVGGRDLDGEAGAYLYFLLRNSGEYLIKRRDGDKTTVVQDWTAHPAIAVYGPDSGSSVENILGVAASAADLAFSINGEEVARHPRAGLPADGIAGLRLNHHVNVHVSDLRVEPAGEDR